jgi:DNA modification methylase
MVMSELILGDCLEKLKDLPDNSIDAIVTDPPYGLSFMGKKWDYDVPKVEIWQECLRVLKPGGYLLSFAGTRTQHRMAVNIEDAGFEIRDMIAWIYGSGFPKSLNIGKAVDNIQGNEREVIGSKKGQGNIPNDRGKWGLKPNEDVIVDKGSSDWEGWGSALKPALEPITVARKPIEGTIAQNCLKYGVGGINIDECRVEGKLEGDPNRFAKTDGGWGVAEFHEAPVVRSNGRFPANFIHDGSDEVMELFNGSARFFYCAKASKSERNMGCEGLEEKKYSHDGREKPIENAYQRNDSVPQNHHPTVKPLSLMEYLVKLVSREGQLILDPFAGSGTTLMACKKLKRNYIGIEREAEYIKIAECRINAVKVDQEESLF